MPKFEPKFRGTYYNLLRIINDQPKPIDNLEYALMLNDEKQQQSQIFKYNVEKEYVYFKACYEAAKDFVREYERVKEGGNND